MTSWVTACSIIRSPVTGYNRENNLIHRVREHHAKIQRAPLADLVRIGRETRSFRQALKIPPIRLNLFPQGQVADAVPQWYSRIPSSFSGLCSHEQFLAEDSNGGKKKENKTASRSARFVSIVDANASGQASTRRLLRCSGCAAEALRVGKDFLFCGRNI